MRALSNKPVTKENAAEVLNLEIIPYLRELKRVVDNGIATAEAAAAAAQADADAAQASANAAQVDADAAQVSADAAQVDADAAAAAAASRGFLYEFNHRGQNGTADTRRMFGSYTTSSWSSSIGKWDRRIVPYAGKLKKLLVQNPSASAGGGNTVTYTVIVSTDGGTTWSNTALSVAILASDETVTVDTGDIAVNAGDMIGVEITFSGAVTAISTDDAMVAAVWYERDAA